jgi:ATP-dependent Clp protease ATP-binding subunit ClpA
MTESHYPSLFQANGRLRLELLTDRLVRSMRCALDSAEQTGWESIRSPHLFIGLLEELDDPIREWASIAKLDPHQLRNHFIDMFDESGRATSNHLVLHREFFSDGVLRLLRSAQQLAHERACERLTTIDILIAVLRADPSVVSQCLQWSGYKPRVLTRLALRVARYTHG